MAERWSTEGLDWKLGMLAKAGTPPATLYLGLFVGASPTTVPGAAAVLSTYTGVTEASYQGYARVAIPASSWGAVGDKTVWSQTGRGVTAAQAAFPAATARYETQINGFFLCTDDDHGAEVGLQYSNFDTEQGFATLEIGDVIKIGPTWVELP